MSSHDEQPGSDAPPALAAPTFEAESALAAPAFESLSEPTARELAAYLFSREPEQIRADLRRVADHLGQLRERLLVLSDQQPAEASESESDSERVADLEAEVAALRQQLKLAQTQQSAAERSVEQSAASHEAERQELIQTHRAAAAQVEQLTQELETLREEHHRLELKSDSYAAALVERDSAPPDLAEEIAEAESQFTITGVIEMASDKCGRVAIPDPALREIELLDNDEKAADWARELWKALRALNAYAEESEFFQGGFWEWCEHSNNQHNLWPATPKKLAMSESDTIMQSGPLRRARRFYVDNRIDPSGYLTMQSHMKIAEGGGQHIPRLYFHDDSKGRTGAMHIGFIGPHRLVPTTQT